jgi:hypothetical protein
MSVVWTPVGNTTVHNRPVPTVCGCPPPRHRHELVPPRLRIFAMPSKSRIASYNSFQLHPTRHPSARHGLARRLQNLQPHVDLAISPPSEAHRSHHTPCFDAHKPGPIERRKGGFASWTGRGEGPGELLVVERW